MEEEWRSDPPTPGNQYVRAAPVRFVEWRRSSVLLSQPSPHLPHRPFLIAHPFPAIDQPSDQIRPIGDDAIHTKIQHPFAIRAVIHRLHLNGGSATKALQTSHQEGNGHPQITQIAQVAPIADHDSLHCGLREVVVVTVRSYLSNLRNLRTSNAPLPASSKPCTSRGEEPSQIRSGSRIPRPSTHLFPLTIGGI